MRPVSTVSRVLEVIQEVKTRAPAYCTNFFPLEAKLLPWIERGELTVDTRGGAAFFLRKDRDFHRLYFCAADEPTLGRQLATLPELKSERIMLDLVGDEYRLGSLLALLESRGFRRYTRLCRMTRPAQPVGVATPENGLHLAYAVPGDAGAIAHLLEASFDPYSEQLPAGHEIETAIDQRQILVSKREGQLAGLLFFETQGFTSAIRYWVVAPAFRAFRCGSALMRRYFSDHESVRRFVLWVVADNADAVQKYRHYGYAPDKLIDQVLANEMIRP